MGRAQLLAPKTLDLGYDISGLNSRLGLTFLPQPYLGNSNLLEALERILKNQQKTAEQSPK